MKHQIHVGTPRHDIDPTTGRGHENERLLSQKPFQVTFGDSRDFLLAPTAEHEAWRSIMKSGYPFHPRVPRETCRYLLMQRMVGVLVVGTGR